MFVFFLLFGWLTPLDLSAQDHDPVDTVSQETLEVGRVLIIGNKVTRDRIIMRELSLHTGDTISSKNLEQVLTRDRNKIYNLRLFNTVTIRPISIEEKKIDLLV